MDLTLADALGFALALLSFWAGWRCGAAAERPVAPPARPAPPRLAASRGAASAR